MSGRGATSDNPRSERSQSVADVKAPPNGGTTTTTRRGFLGGTGKKAAFIVPAVWTLSAPKAMAAGSNPSANPSCATDGEICVTNTDCCSDVCAFGRCVGD
ncbi:MAG: hypothetical protein PVI86_17880 [Phycisphaerae bacterium]|jgi:hypothetical protein